MQALHGRSFQAVSRWSLTTIETWTDYQLSLRSLRSCASSTSRDRCVEAVSYPARYDRWRNRCSQEISAATALMTEKQREGTAAEVFAAFLKLGLTSFGGPIAHIGYFRYEFVERRNMARRAGLCRPRGALPVPARPGQQPGRILARPDARGLWRRAGGVDELHAAVRRSCWCCLPMAPVPSAVPSERAWYTAEARRGRDRGASGVGHGAHAVSGSHARLDRRRRGAADPVQHLLDRADRRDPASRRHCRACAVPQRSRRTRVAISRCRCRGSSGCRHWRLSRCC